MLECKNNVRAKGYCNSHYMRVWRSGSAKEVRKRGTVEQRLAFMSVALANGCVEWRGAVDQRGYGRIANENGWNDMAHRVAYRLAYGDIRSGKVIHHKCFNTRCVNPEHLEETTHRENIIEKGLTNAAHVNSKKTHCIHGHSLADCYIQNTKYGKQRICKQCHARRVRAYLNKKRGVW